MRQPLLLFAAAWKIRIRMLERRQRQFLHRWRCRLGSPESNLNNRRGGTGTSRTGMRGGMRFHLTSNRTDEKRSEQGPSTSCLPASRRHRKLGKASAMPALVQVCMAGKAGRALDTAKLYMFLCRKGKVCRVKCALSLNSTVLMSRKNCSQDLCFPPLYVCSVHVFKRSM
mmetsp:Transcript_69608/g.132838  ORF Transcript_69608/g.132838 Transcript_69608/m.132838 type:complete len:170 (-) Transcript_69608:12-521(-)